MQANSASDLTRSKCRSMTAKAAVSSRRNRVLQPVFEELQPGLEILEHDVEDGRVCREQSIPLFHQGRIVFFGALHGRQNLFAIISAADGIETSGYVDCLKDEFIERDELRAHGRAPYGFYSAVGDAVFGVTRITGADTKDAFLNASSPAVLWFVLGSVR